MMFRDQKLVCEQCGRSFFFTVTEQRRLAEELGEESVVAPHLCPTCRRQGEPVSPVTVEAVPPARDEAPSTARSERPQAPSAGAGVRVAPAEPVDAFPLEEEGIEVKLIGEVKWFNRSKGYGFITKADGEDVFFHRSDVVDRQLSQIQEGVQVEFQLRYTDKGPEAFNVGVLPTP